MPISEDEYDSRPSYEPSSTMSKAELRKTHKPIMEKRRRARINHCLNEIKSLILDAMKKDPARHSKLEKADILEMAVKHLQNVQRQQLALAMASDPSVLRKFKAGFNECADEVNRYIGNLDGIDAALQQRIATHLSKCISGIEQIVHLNFPGFGGVPFLANTNFFSNANETGSETSGDQNNNPSLQIPQSLQVIPSRLPTGEFALLVPNSSNLPYFPSVSSPTQNSQGSSQDLLKPASTRPSAFVTVIPSTFNPVQAKSKSPSKLPFKLLSPPQSPSSSSSSLRQEDEISPPSPRGFRPVHPLRIGLQTQRNVTDLVSSSSEINLQTEVKTMRFPIQKFSSPQKLAEPLSIITNQSERYKHAQVLDETANYEENLQRGIKRKNEYPHSGLLTVAAPTSKIMKTYHDPHATDFRISKHPETAHFHQEGSFSQAMPCESAVSTNYQMPSTSTSSDSKSDPPSNSDMWRPW
ncbi:hypothetical protein PPYR_11844 [Photinus pyralis]|uniref:BHLH domain-containing protein n=2 Tax=Photinus pyralis TaxID=7054 RepID=A0A5N4ACF2_PHOPY|nr:protein deadpan-like [Photinus pyralis]KAB0795005.1 hypothetical protein PPYR_11844 [Photinus pyralis]